MSSHSSSSSNPQTCEFLFYSWGGSGLLANGRMLRKGYYAFPDYIVWYLCVTFAAAIYAFAERLQFVRVDLVRWQCLSHHIQELTHAVL